LNQFLVELDGLKKSEQSSNILIIAATNLEENLDSALTRAGRFDKTIRMSPPDLKARVDLLKYFTQKVTQITQRSNM
jgi:SpoVK/Ycf46/Vps4 family AAA+-type ATPase